MFLARFLFRYHAYRVIGMKHIPRSGPAMIAVSHSFATYDSIILGAKIFLETKRYPASLADRRIFQTPGFAQFFTGVGAVEGSPKNGEAILRRGNLLLLSPGGMRESLRSSNEKYKVNWEGRMGFVRLAIKTQTPVLLAACPAADDIFTLYENPITPAIYENFRWPFPVLRGLGPTPVPRPVRLTHYISKPFKPPPLRGGRVNEADVCRFHAKLVKEINKLMQKEKA